MQREWTFPLRILLCHLEDGNIWITEILNIWITEKLIFLFLQANLMFSIIGRMCTTNLLLSDFFFSFVGLQFVFQGKKNYFYSLFLIHYHV